MARRNINMIGLVTGPGAGSKYLHTLLDSTEGIYTIPGYCLMYFYPHYIQARKNENNNECLIYSILNRMPALYDTRIMPGSESLNALGVNGDKFLCTSIEDFGSRVLEKLDSAQSELVSSRVLLIALHEAHYEIFAKKDASTMPNKIIYHIHCDLYIPNLKKDFPKSKIIATYRRPTVNIDRRTEASILEADEVKLTKLDYQILKPHVLAKMSYYHLNIFRIHKKYFESIYYADYDDILKDEVKVVNDVRKWIDLKTIKAEDVYPTYAGLEHKLSFYEKHRSKSIKQIREENKIKSRSTRYTLLDRVYENLKSGKCSHQVHFWDYSKEIFSISEYEKKFITDCIDMRKIITFYMNIKSSGGYKYNMRHAYYCFKWSTPKLYIRISAMLHEKRNSKNKSLKIIWGCLSNIIYGIVYPLSLTIIPFFLLKKRINQMKLLLLMPH
ncbi:hypothetical protein [Synechococcus sp. UW179B]|uniref:hypothetical protein n=1 Tax=Synechococcus sp. UW179B TaxID=2575516 RepID=UPI0010BD47CD|nr:hypothetical protein [Synechococcus sp. UW179B]